MRTVDEIMLDIDNATPDELLALANDVATGEEIKTETDVDSDAKKITANDEIASSSDVKVNPPASNVNKDEAPVLSKDGAHTIPYEVLQQTREAAKAASLKAETESAARKEAENQLAILKSELDNAKAGITKDSVVSKEELDALREDFPDYADKLEKIQAEIVRVQTVAATQQQAQIQAQQAAESARAAVEVQSLIDANPKLAYLQAEGKEGWQRAVALDNALKDNPDFAQLPMSERFNKTIASYEALYGSIKAPSASQKVANNQLDVVLSKQKNAVPNSLSDLPGGSAVANTEFESLQALSATEIGAKMSSMSPKQLEVYLNSLG